MTSAATNSASQTPEAATLARQSWRQHCRAALAGAIRLAADQFPHPGDDKAERIHDVRKTLKQAAGLSRLFIPLVGPPAAEALKTINATRRRVGRARDLDIFPGVLARLEGANEARDILLHVIADQREAERRAHGEADVAGVSAQLRALARSVEAWEGEDASAEALLVAVRRTYRAARRIGEQALSSGDAKALHALRARVVDLAHQLAAFESAWPDLFQAVCRELNRLRRTLGDHNDLSVLADFAHGRPELPAGAAEALSASIVRRRRPLERRAKVQFARLFAERARAFERRVGRYLQHPQRRPGRTAPSKVRDSAP
jgi:CHAD domain-containing protein